VGGSLFDSRGYQTTFVTSAAVLLFGAFLTLLTSRSQTPRLPEK
jgi:predicted MFS family arabinose efflux permease